MSNVEEDREFLTSLARKYFKYENPNPGQIEAAVEAVRLFRSGIKHVILQAPCGTGKSMIGYMVHKMLRHLDDSHRTTLITATKGLQQQYSEEFKEVFDLKGRANYSCPYDKAPYNSGACRAHVNRGGCKKQVECPYVMRRVKWSNMAEIRSTNNSFQIEAPPEICMKPENRANLIIADEAHDLDDAIVEHTSIKLFAQEYMALGQYGKGEFMKQVQSTIDLFGSVRVGEPFKLSEEMLNSVQGLTDSINDMIGEFEEMLKERKRTDHDAIGNIIESLLQIGDKSSMLESAREGEWIINEYDPGRSILIKPIFAWQVANYALFRKADYFLHMSATICGFDEYAGVLGLKEGEFECLDIPNPIPVKNRMVYVVANQKISAGYDIKKLASDVDKLILRHGNQNGIIHTVSYKLANEIYTNSSLRDRMLVTKERDEIINELKQHNTGRIVLSAAIEKGYDFKDDMSRYQIIVKTPWLFLGDPLVKLNSERRGSWYARKAILRLVQACGRSVRGVNDHATTYILDNTFKRLYSQNRDIFPQWFCDSVVMKPE